MNTNEKIILRKEIWMCDLGEGVGSEQRGKRPCLICSNDINNSMSSTVNVYAITGNFSKRKLPVHVELKSDEYNLPKDSIILTETVRQISKDRLLYKITVLDDEKMDEVDNAIKIQLGLIEMPIRKPRVQPQQRKPFISIPVPSHAPAVAFA